MPLYLGIFFLLDFKIAYVVEHHLHVPEWYYMPELELWINSYGAPKFPMISIWGKLHPLFS
jgi:hypothetical protein